MAGRAWPAGRCVPYGRTQGASTGEPSGKDRSFGERATPTLGLCYAWRATGRRLRCAAPGGTLDAARRGGRCVRRETFLLTGAALVLAVAGVASLLLSGERLPQEPSTDKPNIVLILTDDQDARSLDYMPRVKAQLIDRGTTFDNGFVTDPLCCPSRATILRGQYVHNHTIRGNTAPDAHDRFRDLGLEESTVAMWLHEGGYRTALIGKYMNAYDQFYIPPGWDYWFAAYGYGNYRKYNDNGTLVDYPDESPSTNVLADKLLAYLESTEDNPKPFFLYLATYDPHWPSTPVRALRRNVRRRAVAAPGVLQRERR